MHQERTSIVGIDGSSNGRTEGLEPSNKGSNPFPSARRRAMELRKDCPYCRLHGLTPDTKKHLYVNTTKNVFFCQRCNHRGTWEESLSFPNLWSPTPKTLYDDIDIFSFTIAGGEEIYTYITGRLPKEVVMDRVRWSPQLGNRAMFPLWSERKIYAWQARAIETNVHPKYISYGSISNYLYNLENVKDWVVLCEGPINALSVPHGVASFGKNLSTTQFFLLTNRFKKVIIAFDFGAEKEAKKIEEALKPFVEVAILKFEDERDANDVGYEEMEERIMKYVR